MTETRVGRVQLRIMRVLWQRGRANAREITDALNAEGPIAHSTIAHSTIAHSTIAHSATRELIDRVFGGDAAGLVAYLLREERIPRKELRALRELIEEKASGRGRERPT